ncbi:DUF445 domain-containing protein [Parasphingorhabdus flavimaris]|mgnify:FL=1|uniref:DUF445 domain-containing protein n=1 Tax=Parasphingorhabdus flavimaris TaxID=266812 RepID=A0ABX2N744_9SPHN|nr:DUF445 domain-containing protein [Parasphingorhabdus flavimaris]NVD29413.1 DUF445 domain-containing protein [Parasphingorhabdus flavimaris]|tara:strand:- start:8593 stop:9798 length:1206 start_codon:yes stop_codon:yes gene_type:complete
MKIIATGMLVVMAIIYFTSKNYEEVHPALGFVRAFAEAAMVGGLADWFAVTALFRHPMGLPIPHTAIIPRNKDRIGDTLANFLKDNFLISRLVAQRMRTVDLASGIGRFLKSPSGGEGRLKFGASRLLGDAIASLDKDRLGTMFKGAVKTQAVGLDIATPMGQILQAVMAEKRHGPLIDSTIRWAYRTLDTNELVIRNIVTDRANAVMRWTGLDDRVANEVLDGLYKLLADMAADPGHPVRAKTEESLEQLANELQHDPELRQKVNEWKLEMIDNPAIASWLDGIWEKGREALLRAARDPNAAMAGQFGDALIQLGNSLQQDKLLNRQINRFGRRAVIGVVDSYGDNIVKLVSETVRGWDAQTITDRVENAVGRDLQFIRVNGTLVGGLVGVSLHILGFWI